MLRALQLARCEFDHRIAEVAYRMASQRLHVLPLAEGLWRLRLDLKTAKPVEENGDGAEISMSHQANVV